MNGEGLIRTPKCADLIYDVGLHHGEDTVYYLKKGFRVVAFEAEPDNVRICKERFGQFIDRGQLTIVEGAIVDSDWLKAGRSTVTFYKNQEVSVWGTVSTDWAERNTRLGTLLTRIEVKAVSFEEALRQHGVPHYMKIDIEGAEADVAEVPFSAVSDRLKTVVMEFHPEFIEMRGVSPSDVLRRFEAQGLKIHTNGYTGPLANLATDGIAHYYVMTPH